MPDIDFLPDWYPRLRRKRLILACQAWASAAVLIVAVAWTYAAHRQVRADEAQLATMRLAMDRTRVDQRKLDDLLVLERQWRQRDAVLTQLGIHVEATRLMDKLEDVMPAEMAVLELDMQVEEGKPRAAAATPVLAANVAPAAPADRQLKVRLRGVAPTDVDLGSFMMRLSDVAFFENVAMSYVKDRSEGGHLMREYEVTLTLNLNAPAVN
jgi:Tfp pilus assembly protein PilN